MSVSDELTQRRERVALHKQNIQALTEQYQSEINGLHAEIAGLNDEEQRYHQSLHPAEAKVKELFDAKFELQGLKKTLEAMKVRQDEEMKKNDGNMRTLVDEMRKTQDALRSVR